MDRKRAHRGVLGTNPTQESKPRGGNKGGIPILYSSSFLNNEPPPTKDSPGDSKESQTVALIEGICREE